MSKFVKNAKKFRLQASEGKLDFGGGPRYSIRLAPSPGRGIRTEPGSLVGGRGGLDPPLVLGEVRWHPHLKPIHPPCFEPQLEALRGGEENELSHNIMPTRIKKFLSLVK